MDKLRASVDERLKEPRKVDGGALIILLSPYDIFIFFDVFQNDKIGLPVWLHEC